MSYEKIRVFKPNEFLNDCFSAREYGLCLITDLEHAIKEFPFFYGNIPPCERCERYEVSVMKWFNKWFSQFTNDCEKGGGNAVGK